MKLGVGLFCLSVCVVLGLSAAALADFACIGSIPAHSPAAPGGYVVSGLDTRYDGLLMTVTDGQNSAIYLIDPDNGDVRTSYVWQITDPDSSGSTVLSGVAFPEQGPYWVCDRYSSYLIDFYWSGGDTIAPLDFWKDDHIPYPTGLEFIGYQLFCTDGEVDSLYSVDPTDFYITGRYDINGPGHASALAEMDLPPNQLQSGNLLVCYDAISDEVYEYTQYGEFVKTHHLEGSPFDGGIQAATFYNGNLYLGGNADDIFIFAPVESYSDPLPSGDDVSVEVIPDALNIGFTHVSEAGTLYVEASPTQNCPPPEDVTFFGDFYEVSTTATFDYISKVDLTNEGEFPSGIDPAKVRVFVRPSGECSAWRDITVAMVETEETKSPLLARLSSRLSEDDEFSVFAFGEDRRGAAAVLALKFGYLEDAITGNQSSIPSPQYAAMRALLDAARTACLHKRFTLAARRVNWIADIALGTPEIPHTYDPNQGSGMNVAGRIASRAHTLAFSIGLLVKEDQIADPDAPTWRNPPTNIAEGAGGTIPPVPNPSASGFVISLSGSGERPARVRIYSIEGRLVSTLIDGERVSGARTVTWNGRNDRGEPVAAGTYFAVISEGERTYTQKLILKK